MFVKANGLKYEFGTIPDEGYREWKFTAEQPLIGFYGRSKENSVEQLGFITLDIECQAAIPEPELVEEEPELIAVVVEPEPEKHQGLDGATFFIIAAGIVAFILILVIARYCNTNSSKVAAIEL